MFICIKRYIMPPFHQERSMGGERLRMYDGFSCLSRVGQECATFQQRRGWAVATRGASCPRWGESTADPDFRPRWCIWCMGTCSARNGKLGGGGGCGERDGRGRNRNAPRAVCACRTAVLRWWVATRLQDWQLAERVAHFEVHFCDADQRACPSWDIVGHGRSFWDIGWTWLTQNRLPMSRRFASLSIWEVKNVFLRVKRAHVPSRL